MWLTGVLVTVVATAFLLNSSNGTIHQQHQEEMASQLISYSMTLDADGQMKLTWTPDYDKRQVIFKLETTAEVEDDKERGRRWIAIGFSDRGEWNGADICVGWEDWTGATIVQVFLF